MGGRTDDGEMPGTGGKVLGEDGLKMEGELPIRGMGEGNKKPEGDGRRRPGEPPLCVSSPVPPAR